MYSPVTPDSSPPQPGQAPRSAASLASASDSSNCLFTVAPFSGGLPLLPDDSFFSRAVTARMPFARALRRLFSSAYFCLSASSPAVDSAYFYLSASSLAAASSCTRTARATSSLSARSVLTMPTKVSARSSTLAAPSRHLRAGRAVGPVALPGNGFGLLACGHLDLSARGGAIYFFRFVAERGLRRRHPKNRRSHVCCKRSPRPMHEPGRT